MLLQLLCDARGVNGNEKDIRGQLFESVKDCAARYEVDRIGSLIAYKDGTPGAATIALAAHMDEVGAIVTGFLDDGYVKFAVIGDVDPRVWPAKRVLIGDRNVPGIVGIRSVHLQKPEQRKENVKAEDLYIDIGAETREEAEQIVGLADYIVFDSRFEPFGEHLIKAKALDNRAGCAIVAELFQQAYDVSLIAAFAAQGKVGHRGAVVVANSLEYDAAIVIDACPCDDAFHDRREQDRPRLGAGPVIMYGKHCNDASGIQYDEIERIARTSGIVVQRAVQEGADYHAAVLASGKPAAPVLLVGIPCRNVKSPAELISLQDYEACRGLVRQLLENVPLWLRRE